MRRVNTKQPFEEAPPGYKENWGEVDLDLPCKDGQWCPAKWIKRMDGGKVAGYTKDNAPGDLPLISNLFAPKEYYNDNNNDPMGALPGWFLSALVGSRTTFAMICRMFDQLPSNNWGFVAEVDWYQAIDKQCQLLASQIDLLEQEIQMARMEWGLSKGQLEVAQADRQVCHLWLGQMGARHEQNQVRTDMVQQDYQAHHGHGHPFWQRRWCNRPRVSGSLYDQNTPVSVETSPNSPCSFVLPSLVPCMISIGAASCSLAQTSSLRYHCPLSCSLFCIGMTCGGPCLSPDY